MKTYLIKSAIAASALATATFAAAPTAQADDPVLLGWLDAETSKTLKGAQKQIDEAKKQMGAGIRG